MKKFVCLILLFCLLSLTLSSCVNSADYLGVVENDDDTLIVWDGEAMYLSRVLIPSRINGNPVVAIDKAAFRKNKYVREITIMSGPTVIGSDAFSGCTNLEKVILPDTLTEIGSGAFSNCHSLKEIKIPNGVRSIENLTFYDCRSLERIDIPANMTHIAGDAFGNCTNLKTIRFGGSEEEWKALVNPNSPDLINVSILFGK